MNPDFNETQLLLQSTIRQFLADEVPFDRIREHEEKRTADGNLWQAMANQGWLGIALPEGVGGAGAGLIEAGIFIHELARRAAVVPGVEVMACASLLASHAENDQSELLRAVVEGNAVVVPALLEAGDQFGELEATVDANGALQGDKTFVDYPDFATHHLVSARGPEGPGLYLVSRTDAGVESEARSCTGRTPQADIRYRGAAATRVAGEPAVSVLLDRLRALTSAQILGGMEVSLEMTVEYTNVRVQFGQPLAAFQAVQHHAADMSMHVESNRFLVYELLDQLDRGVANPLDTALVKASVSRSVPYVTMQAHQLHGGQGLIEENDLYFFTIRGKDRSLAWGTAEECLALVASDVETPPRWI
jgi:alkylation response protein AidB-like acyl-CoA dehydrogenase